MKKYLAVQCPNCGYPLEESDLHCPICGTLVLTEDTAPAEQDTPETVAPVKNDIVEETPPLRHTEDAPRHHEKKEPQHRSKKPLILVLSILGILLIAGIVVGMGFFFGWWQPAAKAATAADWHQAVSAAASSQSMTLTVDIRSTYDGVVETDKRIIKLDRTKKQLSVERTLSHDGVVLIEKSAMDARAQYTYEKDGSAVAKGSIVPCDNTADWTALSNALSAIGEQKGLYTVLSNLQDSTMNRYIEIGLLDKSGLQTDLKAIDDCLKDDKWLKEHVNFTASANGDTQLFTMQFDVATLMSLLKTKLTHSLTDTATSDTLHAAVNTYLHEPCTVEWHVKNGTLTTVHIRTKLGKADVTATVTVSSLGQTAVDISGIKTAILTANDQLTDCRTCLVNPAYCLGYCKACYADTMCVSDCGNPAESGCDGHCRACYVRCTDCERHADRTAPDGKVYCETCYATHYCRNEDGNAAYKDGYCKSCFVPCAVCAERFAEFDGDTPLCFTCYYDRFCINGDGAAVFKDHHCEACYTPCLACNDNAGLAYYNGRCATCHEALIEVETVSCVACNAELYDEVFEKDGYTLCFDCYTGAVSMCHYCGNAVAYFTEGQNRACLSCYTQHVLNTPCSRCGQKGLLLSYGSESLCTACYPE